MNGVNIPLVKIRGLTVTFNGNQSFLGRNMHQVRALTEVDLDIYPHETMGVVGESGCGKTTLGRAIMRLIRPVKGEIEFEGVNILSLRGQAARENRRNIQMVFQNPHSSLDPRMKIFDLIAEPLRAHTELRGKRLKDRVSELLKIIGLQDEHLDRFPHTLSGGQAQRVVIARALAIGPKLLVLDEPTSALDVSIQAQIINLLIDLQNQRSLTYIFISHDLAIVRHISQHITVMYLGQIVEQGPTEAIFTNPGHPYTQALLSATPVPDPDTKRKRIILKGTIPSVSDLPEGCPFHTRCPVMIEKCRKVKPPHVDLTNDHWVICHLTVK